MPRIALNPLTTEEMQFAKMSNMLMDKVEGMEELMGEDGTFEEFGDNQTESSTSSCSHCTNCGNEFDMATIDGVNDNKLILDVSTSDGEDPPEDADRRTHTVICGKDVRKLEELGNSWLQSEYRCSRCRACQLCKDADQTEKTSLRQDNEDALIKESVTLDYQKK